MQHGVGRSAGGGHRRNGVLEGFARGDVASLRPARTASITTSPQRNATCCLRGSTCGTDAVLIGESPIISITVAMVLAVNWPPQAPAPGQAVFSIASNSSSVILPAAFAPTASNTSAP